MEHLIHQLHAFFGLLLSNLNGLEKERKGVNCAHQKKAFCFSANPLSLRCTSSYKRYVYVFVCVFHGVNEFTFYITEERKCCIHGAQFFLVAINEIGDSLF